MPYMQEVGPLGCEAGRHDLILFLHVEDERKEAINLCCRHVIAVWRVSSIANNYISPTDI